MKVLVTGGAGFIGSNVVRILEEKGIETYILDDFFHADFRNILDLKSKVICADILDETIYSKLPEVDAVIHEAAVTDTTLSDDTKMMTVNYVGFQRVLHHCLKNKIKLVYASSAGVYGNGPVPMKEAQTPMPLNTYAYSKLLCDRVVLKLAKEKKGIPVVGVRYFNVYGYGEAHKGKSASMIYQLFLQMKNGNSPRIFKYGEQKRDHVYVRDVAKATVRALEIGKTTIVNVGTGQARSFNEVVENINRVMAVKLEATYIDNPYTEVYQTHTHADIEVLNKVLNYVPGYSIEEGIENYIGRLVKTAEVKTNGNT